MNYIIKIPSNFRGTYPAAGKFFIYGAGLCLLLSGYSYYQASGAQSQLQWRKTQLSLPVYRLSEQQHINPPWNSENIDQWLYRRVEVGGRVIHRNTCQVPTQVNGAPGFEYIVPLLVKEESDRSNPQGLIVSKGFIPYSVKNIADRYRIENAKYQKFVGFVSQLPEYQNKSLFQGNSTDELKIGYTCADLQDFVKTAGFVNKKQASVAVVEQLHELHNLDERRSERRAVDCCATVNYPYAKTESGALQLPKMPWEYKRQSKQYFFGSLISLVLGASIF